MKLSFITAPLLTSLVHFAHAQPDPIGYTLFDAAGSCRNGVNKDPYDYIWLNNVSSDAECGRKCDNIYGNPVGMAPHHDLTECYCLYLGGELEDYTGSETTYTPNEAKSNIMTSDKSYPHWKCYEKNADHGTPSQDSVKPSLHTDHEHGIISFGNNLTLSEPVELSEIEHVFVKAAWAVAYGRTFDEVETRRLNHIDVIMKNVDVIAIARSTSKELQYNVEVIITIPLEAWEHVTELLQDESEYERFLTNLNNQKSNMNGKILDVQSEILDVQYPKGMDGEEPHVPEYAVLCEGQNADQYCDCSWDCENQPAWCSCSEAEKCCAENAPSAGAQGDPHFKSWSQKAFDFHGVCDLVMLSNQKFENNLGIDIHIRTKKMRSWSYISALAIRIGKEILEVVGEYGGSYNVNGIVYQGNSDGVLMLSGYPIHYKRKSSKQQTLRLNLGPLEAISIETWNSFVSVHFENPKSKHFKDSMGLLGSFPDGIWLARDNVTVIDDANTFGQEWQVLEPEANLFHEAKGPQQPLKKCEIPSNLDMRRRLSEHTMTKNEAERACVDVKADNVDICVFDVMATNDIVTTGAY